MEVLREKINKIDIDLALVGQAMEANNQQTAELNKQLRSLSESFPVLTESVKRVSAIDIKIDEAVKRQNRIDTRLKTTEEKVGLISKLLFGAVGIVLSSLLYQLIEISTINTNLTQTT